MHTNFYESGRDHAAMSPSEEDKSLQQFGSGTLIRLPWVLRTPFSEWIIVRSKNIYQNLCFNTSGGGRALNIFIYRNTNQHSTNSQPHLELDLEQMLPI